MLNMIFWIVMIPIILLVAYFMFIFIYGVFMAIMEIGFFKIILFGFVAFVFFTLLLGKEHTAFSVFAFACLVLLILWLKGANIDDKEHIDKSSHDNSIIHEKPPELPHSLKYSPPPAPQPTLAPQKSNGINYGEIKKQIAEMKSAEQSQPNVLCVNEYRRAYQMRGHNRLSNAELGKRYERYCGYLREINGYEVEYSGIVRGKKDDGIDLRAFRQGKMMVVQCKFWSNKITSRIVSQFIGDLEREKDENTDLEVFGMFCCKNDKFESGCKERLEKRGILVRIQDYNNEYPCVKCILASRLYYTPYHNEYDSIRFSIQRGDRHCYDEQAAEKLGFKKAP